MAKTTAGVEQASSADGPYAVRSAGSAAEAERWLDEVCGDRPIPPLLIVVGLGDGYLLDVLDRRAPATKVLALEPDPAIADACMRRRVARAWHASGRLCHLVDHAYHGADQAWRLFPRDTEACTLMVNPRLAPADPATGRAARAAQKILFGVRANAEARRQFAPKYLTNVIRNIPAMLRGRDVSALRDAFRGVPAVVAAAGPSLDSAIASLATVHDRALFIAVDTALRPLLDAGITPHLVTALDPGVLNARHFQALQACPDTWLVAESALHRSATEVFDGRTFWMRVSNHHPWPWLSASGINVGQVDVWGSVLTAGFQVACLAGCDPIILVGADLAYTNGQPYCRGTTYEFDWAWHTATGKTLAEAWQLHIDATKSRAAIDVHGGKTMTSGALESFRDWLVPHAKRSGRRVINATGAGTLLGDGVKQGTLQAQLSKRVALPRLDSLGSSPDTSIDARHVATQIARVTRALTDGELDASPLADWIDFSEAGFDAAALRGALEEAETALRLNGSGPLVGSKARLSILARVMPALPEGMIRLRTALDGAATPFVLDDPKVSSKADRAAFLIDALAMLGDIHDVVAGQPDLQPTLYPTLTGKIPASALYAWPEVARWPVEVFESALGRAWGGPVRAENTFFNAPVVPRLVEPGALPARNDEPYRTHAMHACMVLAIEWVRCALSLASESAPSVSRIDIDRLMGLESIALTTIHDEPAAMLTLRASGGGASADVELPLCVPLPALSRVLTGTVRCEVDASTMLVRMETDSLNLAVGLESLNGRVADRSHASHRARVFQPRCLVDERVQRAAIAYSVPQGVVCAKLHGTESVLVREDGRIDAHQSWPRPITSELPFGDGGAIAWDQGRVTASMVIPSYVMYRRSARDAVTIEALPFNPSLGAWWRGRMYWSYAGADGRPGRGIASWAPGEPVRFDIDDVAVYDMFAEDAWLRLEPRYVSPENRVERRQLTQGWKWNPADGLMPIPLGPEGASSGRASANGWTATAFPESDLVELRSADGAKVPITVYYPNRVAWAGRSLLVGSFQSGLLLFEGLADELDRARGGRAG